MMKTGVVQFEVIVGTYEEFVLGFQFSTHKDGKSAELLHTFATHSHRASVRSVACRGKLVVSGGADETINIYNMATRKECGMLMEHNGTITSLSFTPDGSHLVSTSEDGTIKVFRQGSWQVEKVWHSAHKGTAVTCLSVHPSGKMALSVGKDHTLRTWNLVKGRPAYTTNLFSRCRQLELVVWSPGGQLFAIPMDCQLELSSTDKAGVLHTLKMQTKLTTCVFLSDKVVCVGEASGEISGHCTETTKHLWSISGNQRVRGLAYIDHYLIAATSSGSIYVYSVEDVTVQPKQVACTDSGCRITCMTVFDFKSEMSVKKEPSDRKTPEKLIETVTTKFKRKNETKFTQEICEIDADDSSITKSVKEKVSGNIEKVPEAKNKKSTINSKKCHQNNSSSFIEMEGSFTNKSKKKKSTEEQKSVKKQKTTHNSVGSIIYSPGAQKWIVEDSKR